MATDKGLEEIPESMSKSILCAVRPKIMHAHERSLLVFVAKC